MNDKEISKLADTLTAVAEMRKSEKTITTAELAKQLNTSPKVILQNARRCLPNKKIKNGKPTFWSEAEVTLLIEFLKRNNPNQHSFTGAVKAVSTKLTPALKIKQAMILMQEGYEEELARIASEKKNLEIELDKAKEFITVKRMEKLNPTMHFDWRLLKKESIRLGEAMKDTFDQNYGTVKAYHKNVWESLYYDSINYPA